MKLIPIKPKTDLFTKKTGYKLELLTPETMRLLGITKKVVDKDKNREKYNKIRICWSCFSSLKFSQKRLSALTKSFI